MSAATPSPDDAIILQLTRGNAALRRARDMAEEELTSIAETLTALGVDTQPKDPFDPEGFTVAHRMHLLQQRIKAFPLELTDRYHELPGYLFKVTTPTSIEAIEDYVVAADEAAVHRWVLSEHPNPSKGCEPTVENVSAMTLGRVYLITKPEGACCESERRNLNGGCDNCGAPCL